jgi:hypothetical protein
MSKADLRPPLPNFERPPVAEVILSVAFEPVQGLGVIELARLWEEKFRGEFPGVEEQPPWQMPIERLSSSPGTPNVSLEVFSSPPMPRLWFISERGTELVQVQRDWFARNWRKMDSPEGYPRYASLRRPFEEALSSLANGLEAEGVLEGLGEYGLVSVTVREVRQLGLGVVMAERPQLGPIGVAHAHVHGKKTGGRKNVLAKGCSPIVWPFS